SCGVCDNCLSDHPAYCENFFRFNLAGRRPDGAASIHAHGEPIAASFFGQSSFANFTLSRARNTVKVRADAPLELLGPLGCGFQTGAGAVINVLRPQRRSTLAVFGCGGVGLAAVMAARMLECETIVAIDVVERRLDLARSLGATHTVNPAIQDPVEIISALGGAHGVIEATGIPAVLEQAIKVTRPRGICGVLGGPNPTSTLTLNIVSTFMSGRQIMGILEGDANPGSFIPYLVERFMAGEFPIDRLITLYDFNEINRAIEDSKSGLTVKPVVRFPA
ncbi:MAG: xylB, partial [Gammaproteobacteria bacterium]|nr:xylB [Gammaproteobacteria bacterium]